MIATELLHDLGQSLWLDNIARVRRPSFSPGMNCWR